MLQLNLNFLFKFNSMFSRYVADVDVSFIRKTKFVNARFLSRFISRRLSFGFELNRVLNPIVLDLKKLVTAASSKLFGFKIACSGRFNKTQMATYSWEKFGPIRLNNFSASVDYSFSKVFMRYGACGIKVWLFTSQRPFKSYKNNFVSILFNNYVEFICNKRFGKNSNSKILINSWMNVFFKLLFFDGQIEFKKKDIDLFTIFLKNFVIKL